MRRIFAVTAVVVALLTPALAHAAVVEFPLVQCGGATQIACTPCELFGALNRVINLVLFGITAPIAAFMIVLAGGRMLLGGANPSSYSRGKDMLTNTLWGVTVILLAWVATNFLLQALGGGVTKAGPWYEFSCPAFLESAPKPPLPSPTVSQGSPQQPAPVLVQENANICTDRARLAGAYKANPNVTAIAPSLTRLMSCIEQDPVVRALIDNGQKFMFDVDNPLCNLTHGYPVCGKCGHGRNACHNGGKTGTQGAMAVDYNILKRVSVRYEKETRRLAPVPIAGEDPTKFRTVGGGNEQALYDEIYRSIVRNSCQFGWLDFEPQSGGHTHISTTDCDSDAGLGVGVVGKGRAPPVP